MQYSQRIAWYAVHMFATTYPMMCVFKAAHQHWGFELRPEQAALHAEEDVSMQFPTRSVHVDLAISLDWVGRD